MRLRSVLRGPVVLCVLLVGLWGCSKKEETPAAEKPSAPESKAQVTDTESPKPTEPATPVASAEPPVSPVMGQFLKQVVRVRRWAAGQDIAELFASWQNNVQNNPRNPMAIHFEVEVNEKLEQDGTWKAKSNRQFLDEFCQEHNLLWTIAGPDTIRIDKKPL